MSAFQFLNLAEERGLLDPATADKARAQLAKLERSVSTDEMAAMLVKRGRLTEFQAQSLSEAVRQLEQARAEGVDLMADTEGSSLELIADSDAELTPLEAMPIAEPVEVPSEAIVMEDDLEVVGDEPPIAGLVDEEGEWDAGGTPSTAGRFSLKSMFQSMFSRRTGWQRSRGGPSFLVWGGGALALLSLLAVLLYFFLTRETGDSFFEQAESAYAEQSYDQAIKTYDKFISKFPSHPKCSEARVHRELAAVRERVERENWQGSLATFDDRIPQITAEQAYEKYRPELAGILPEIYEGFAKAADAAVGADEKEQLLQLALESRARIDDPQFLGPQRVTVEVRVNEIENITDKVFRDIQRERELGKALVQIQDAVDKNDTVAAYAVHKSLLDDYPGLRANRDLMDRISEIAAAERGAVVVGDGQQQPETKDHRTKVASRVVLARRQTTAKANAVGQVFAMVHGALYGLDAETGKVLWRRWMGFDSTKRPVTIGATTTDVIAFDDARQELLRLDGPTGQLKWRLEVKEPSNRPIVGARIYLSTESGRLLSIDPSSGRVLRVAQLPQSLYAPPCVSRDGMLFQPGAHSSLFVLDADSLNCLSVHAVGHRTGAVTEAAFLVGDYVLIPERISGDTTTLHAIRLADEGQVAEGLVANDVQVDGYVVSTSSLADGSVLVTTELGAAHVVAADRSDAERPLRKIATKPRSSTKPGLYFGAAIEDQLVIAGRGLGRFEVQGANGSLVSRWELIEPSFHTAPPEVRGSTLFVQYKRLDNVTRSNDGAATSQAVRVSALEWGNDGTREPNTKWVVELGASPAGPAFFDKRGRGIIAVSDDAAAWKIGSAAMKSKMLDTSVADLPGRTTFGFPQAVEGRRFFSAAGGKSSFLVYDGAARSSKLRRSDLQISDKRLACPIVVAKDSLVACSLGGGVYLADLKTGKQLVQPFQAVADVAAQVDWVTPVVLKNDLLVVGNKAGYTALLGVEEKRLTARVKRIQEFRIESPLVAIGDRLFVVGANGPLKAMHCLQADDLTVVESVELPSGCDRGPYLVGQQVACVNRKQQLESFSSAGKRMWTTELLDAPLAGPPVWDKGTWLLASVNGKLWRVDAKSGKTLPWRGSQADHFDVGEPLGAAPFMMGSRLVLLGRDCTMFVVSLK